MWNLLTYLHASYCNSGKLMLEWDYELNEGARPEVCIYITVHLFLNLYVFLSLYVSLQPLKYSESRPSKSKFAPYN